MLLALAIRDWLILVAVRLDRAVFTKPPVVEEEPTTRHLLAVMSYTRLMEASAGRLMLPPVPVRILSAAVATLTLASWIVAVAVPAFTMVRMYPSLPFWIPLSVWLLAPVSLTNEALDRLGSVVPTVA